MNGTFRQSMSKLHTWTGLVLGWVLYFMFITGATGFFSDEISRWMQPEIPFTDKALEQANLLSVAEQRLKVIAPKASAWWISFSVGRYPGLAIEWQDTADMQSGQTGLWQDETLNPTTGAPVLARDTGGGQWLYRLHYLFHYIPAEVAYLISSFAALCLLVALISGVVIHKKIFTDFFTFRPGKHQRAWLDMHNLLGVLPLPFHLMMAYSGLIFLMFTTMPAILTASYGPDEVRQAQFFDAAFSRSAHQEAAGSYAETEPLIRVLRDAEQRWGKGQVRYIGIENRNDANAHIEVIKQAYSGISGTEELTYSGVSGELQNIAGADANNNIAHSHVLKSHATQFYEVITSLHEGLFAGPVLRWMYFFSGLAGAGMIATGMILWTAKRRIKSEKNPSDNKGLILVEHLNVSTIVGLPIAIAAYFWANRLIPVNIEARAAWEAHTLFITWGAMLIYPLVFACKRSLERVWFEQLVLAATLYGLLPVINALSTDRHLGITLIQGDWALAGFDSAMLGIALCFAFAAQKVWRKVFSKRPGSSLSVEQASRSGDSSAPASLMNQR